MKDAYYIVDLKTGVYSPIKNFGTSISTFEEKVNYAFKKADGVRFAIANENKEIISYNKNIDSLKKSLENPKTLTKLLDMI